MNKVNMKLLSLLMALMLSLGFVCGCGDKASDEGNDSATQAEEPTTTVSEDRVTLSDDSSDFVLVTDVVPDAIFEIRYYSTYNFVGDRIDGYEEPLAFMTKEAADALKEVSDDVKEDGYRLKIYDAYRPQEAVTNFVEWAKVSGTG